MPPSSVCVTGGCQNTAAARGLCIKCLVRKIDELEAAVNLTSMQKSTVNSSEEDDSSLSSIAGNSSIVVGNDVATLEGRFPNRVDRSDDIKKPFLVQRPHSNATADVVTPRRSNKLSPTYKKKSKKSKKKSKKFKGYVSSMKLRRASDVEEKEMINHGELL
jgi:hypothetical protein